MSWMLRSRPHVRRAAAFHARRMREEGFASSYVQPTPEWTLVKMVMVYPSPEEVSRGRFYYMDLGEYVEHLLATARDVAESRGWGFVGDVAVAARRAGLVKDPPILVAEIAPRDQVARVLAESPPPLIHRFAELARKRRGLLGGLGSRKKRAIAEVMASWPIRRQEVYAARYRRVMRDLLRMVHPRPPSPEVSALWRWALGKGDPPTDMTRAVADVWRLAPRDPEAALRCAIEGGVPLEVVRSHVRHDAVPIELLHEAYARLATPIAAYSMLSTFAARGRPDLAEDLARRFADRVPASYGFRAVIGLAAQGHRELAGRVEKLLQPRLREVVKEVSLPIGGVPDRAVFLIDVSASMSGGGIRRALSVAYPLRGLAEEVLVFNSGIMPPRPVELRSIDDYFRIYEMPSGGTPLVEAVRHAAEEARRLGAQLWVFTDEMGNIFAEDNIASIPGDVRALVFNVSPYPTEHIPKDAGRVVGLPTASIDTARAGVALLQLNAAQSEGVVPQSVVEKILRAP